MSDDAITSTGYAAPKLGLMEIAILLLRHRRWTVGLPVLFASVTCVVVLLLPRWYSASATFVPQRSQSQLGRLAGLAAQFGVAIPTQNAAESSDFYAELCGSREILSRIVIDSFAPESGGQPRPLTVLLGAHGSSRDALVQDGVRRLGRLLATDVDSKTGLVTVSVRTRWAAVSASIVERVTQEVEGFDLQTRQSQATAERIFVEGRLADAKAELRDAEDHLQAFLASNRQYRDSPALLFEYDRLSRAVTNQQQVATTLQQDYEQARIDEVRDTPRIIVVEPALVPARPDPRRIVLRTLLAMLVGVVLGWPLAIGIEGSARLAASQPEEAKEFRQRLHTLLKWKS